MKKVFLFSFLALIWLFCHASKYMIGAYSLFNLENHGAVSNIDSLKSKLLDGGFNTVQLTIQNDCSPLKDRCTQNWT